MDEVDVADLASEEAHRYSASAQQSIFQKQVVKRRPVAFETDASFIDGGRVITRSEQFVLNVEPNQEVILRGRFISDLPSPVREFGLQQGGFNLDVKVNGEYAGIFRSIRPSGGWVEREFRIPGSLTANGRLEIEVSVKTPWEYESYHYWLLR